MKNSKNKAKINYDEISDILYIVVEYGPEHEFVELAPNINIELGEKGKVIGVEIIQASKVLNPMVEKLKRAV